MSTQELQETNNTTRKFFKTQLHIACDKENLVGRSSKNLKQQLLVQDSPSTEAKRKNEETKYKSEEIQVNDKEIQVDLNNVVTVDDLTNPEGPSENYWKILAGKRQVALQETLNENENLRKIIEDLKEENRQFKQMLEEANSFIEVVKEELNNDNDTGIDVNDVSTADETYESDSEPKAKTSKTE